MVGAARGSGCFDAALPCDSSVDLDEGFGFLGAAFGAALGRVPGGVDRLSAWVFSHSDVRRLLGLVGTWNFFRSRDLKNY